MSRSTYARRPHQQLPAGVAAWLRTIRSSGTGASLRGRNHTLTAALIAVRDADWGIPAIAAALGMDPRSVARRICRGRHQTNLPVLGYRVPAAPVPAIRKQQRLPDMPEALAGPLRAAYTLADRRRKTGHEPNHPAVAAAEHLDLLIIDALRRGYRSAQITRAAGARNHQSLYYRLNRLGISAAQIRPKENP